MINAIVIMGVCGTGKTTLGQDLAAKLECAFLEGDSFHPRYNIEKMSTGIPLTDDDRWPWLDRLGEAMKTHSSEGQIVIAACSALKRAYRDRLRDHVGEATLFVLLHGDQALLRNRLAERSDHYMPPSLLDSQLAILEPPGTDETSLSLDVARPPAVLADQVEREIRGRASVVDRC